MTNAKFPPHSPGPRAQREPGTGYSADWLQSTEGHHTHRQWTVKILGSHVKDDLCICAGLYSSSTEHPVTTADLTTCPIPFQAWSTILTTVVHKPVMILWYLCDRGGHNARLARCPAHSCSVSMELSCLLIGIIGKSWRLQSGKP